MSELKPLLTTVSEFVATLDGNDPDAAEAALNRHFPADGAVVLAIRDAALAAQRAGALCTKGEPGMQFARVVKPADDPVGCSVDAVFMEDAEGPAHTHPNGEFCLCIHDTGTPTFEGRADTWIVMKSGSRHVPTVKNGRMLILYWLPEGAVTWG